MFSGRFQPSTSGADSSRAPAAAGCPADGWWACTGSTGPGPRPSATAAAPRCLQHQGEGQGEGQRVQGWERVCVGEAATVQPHAVPQPPNRSCLPPSPAPKGAGRRTHLDLDLPDAAARERGDELLEEHGEEDGNLDGPHHAHLHTNEDVGVPATNGKMSGAQGGGGGTREQTRACAPDSRVAASRAAGPAWQTERPRRCALVARVRQALVVLERLLGKVDPDADEDGDHNEGEDCTGREGGGGRRSAAAAARLEQARRRTTHRGAKTQHTTAASAGAASNRCRPWRGAHCSPSC